MRKVKNADKNNTYKLIVTSQCW